ncbi:hypothetical protein F5Y14DRAFT_430000 [Nemania sp. NC0429]|nr:hypothetical protein F5Y14DRAFT_430000 [Nemania sp. NC0429]
MGDGRHLSCLGLSCFSAPLFFLLSNLSTYLPTYLPACLTYKEHTSSSAGLALSSSMPQVLVLCVVADLLSLLSSSLLSLFLSECWDTIPPLFLLCSYYSVTGLFIFYLFYLS